MRENGISSPIQAAAHREEPEGVQVAPATFRQVPSQAFVCDTDAPLRQGRAGTDSLGVPPDAAGTAGKPDGSAPRRGRVIPELCGSASQARKL